MQDLICFIESQKDSDVKREAYQRGYRDAVKDMEKRLKLLHNASDFLIETTSSSGKEMVDVTLPLEVYEKLCKTK